MEAVEIQPFAEPFAPLPRPHTSQAEPVSFKDLKSLMADAFREVDAENTHVPEGLCSRADLAKPSRTSDHELAGRSPTSTLTSTRSFQLPRSASTSFNRTLGRHASERLRRELLEMQAWPVLPLTPRMAARLERQCERGVEFLQLLQRPAYSRTADSPGPVMPKTALLYSKGLAFMWQHKVGLISGWTWGTGFVIARLGPGVWSAPCFLRERFYSLGMTAGVSSTATCYAIPTDAGLEHFKHDEPGGGLDAALTLGMDPWEGDTPVRVAAVAERVAPTDRPQDRVKSYKVCDGLILDVSWRCGVHAIDWGANRALYGDSDITPTDILDGKVQMPTEFRPLYNAIERLSQEASGVKATASQFALEKERVRAASMSRQSSLLRRLRKNSGSKRSASGSADGITRRSVEESSGALPSSSSSTTVPSPPEIASPDNSFKLFSDFTPLDINLDDDEPLATITEQHIAETAAIDATA